MNKSLKLLFILALVTMFSCRSSKELIYLKDAVPNDIINRLPVQTTEHILQSGDILYVSIKTRNTELNAIFDPESSMLTNSGGGQKYSSPSDGYLYGFEIDPDGNIKLPMLGVLQVAGVSVSQIESIIQQKAAEYINDAIVKVKLLNFKITIMGEVGSPSVYYNYTNSMTVLEALAMAGGNTDFADIKKVMVIRQTEEGNMAYMLDLSSKDIFSSKAFYLQPNDMIIVQPGKGKNLQLNLPAYSLLISSISLLIAVLGFVR